ncbi:MAG: DsbA family protein [Thermaerobacter sp.]|nr:DsbA family protein [Thermaerobacter sp.]
MDVLSLWCLYADRSVDRLLSEYGQRLQFDWRISLIRGESPLGYGRDAEAFYYRRGAHLTGATLNPNWLSGPETTTLDANLVAEAARSLGKGGRDVPRALMDAAMIEGREVWRKEIAVEVAAEAAGLPRDRLATALADPRVRDTVLATTEEMLALGVSERPVIVFESAIPDRAILSGIWAYEPMAALCEAMLRDEERFLAFNAEYPQP